MKLHGRGGDDSDNERDRDTAVWIIDCNHLYEAGWVEQWEVGLTCVIPLQLPAHKCDDAFCFHSASCKSPLHSQESDSSQILGNCTIEHVLGVWKCMN